MKKIILILSLVVSLLGVAIVALPAFLRVTGFDQPIKAYLFKKILRDQNLEIKLTDFRIGLGTFEISRLSIVPENQDYQLTVKSVQFIYDLSTLLIHPTDPTQALKSISLIEPQIVILKDTSGSRQQSPEQWNKILNFIQVIAREKGINFFKVEKAAILIRFSEGKDLILANNLNGILKTSDFNLFKLKLAGNLLGNDLQKIDLAGDLNLKRKKFKFINNFREFNFKPLELSRFFPQIGKIQANIDGWLLVENDGGDFNKLRSNGQLEFKSERFQYGSLQLDSLSFRTVLTDNRLILDSLCGRLGESGFTGQMFVRDIFKPEFVGQLRVDQLNLSGLPIGEEFARLKSFGLSSEFEFLFNPQKKRLNITGRNGILKYESSVALHDLNFQFESVLDSFRLAHGQAAIAQNDSVWLNFFSDQVALNANFNLRIRHQGGPHVIFDRLHQKQHELNIRGRVDLNAKRLNGTWQYVIHQQSDSVLDVKGRLSGDRQTLSLAVTRSNKQDFKGLLQVTDLFNSWQISQGWISEFPMEKLTSIEGLHNFFSLSHSSFKLSGSLKDGINSEIVFSKKNHPKDRIELQTRITDLFARKKTIQGLGRLKNLEGSLSFQISPEKLSGQFNFQDQILGQVLIDLQKESYLSSQIKFNDFKIMRAISDSVSGDDFRLLGSVNGQLDLAGSFQNPVLNGNLTGDRFVFNDIGYYQFNLKFAANKSFVKLDSLLIAINNLPVIQGRGFADIQNDSLNADFSAKDVDFEQIWFTFFNSSPKLTGTTSYHLTAAGPFAKPQISLDLQMENGFLDRIPFDHFSASLRNEYLNGQNLLDLEKQKVVFDRLEVTKRDRFTLNGLGELPFDPTQEIDFFVNFKGDLLGIIPYYQPFFERATSDVEMHLAFGGSPDQIRLSSGYLLINQGELWMKNVARHVSNISGVIEKKSNSNQVNFINLSGEAGGEVLTINTVRDVKLTDGRKLQPWYVKNFDLDFGVLKLTTTGHGVRLHIPGLMVENDEGRLYLTGINNQESFYFAGPLKHPLVHGKVVLYDTRLTFPFLSQGQPVKKDNSVVNFLENIDWDVLTVSGEDVLYFREIPAYIDNVNTELYIDESSPGLHFSGILNEGTFNVSGKISSSRGRLEYLDQTFRVDFFQAEFTQNSPYPIISGQAWTTIRDSIGAIPKTIYLKLYAIDKETHQEKQQGSWEDFKFKLVSADPQIGESQELVLADLGFSVGNIADKVTSVGGAVTEKYLFRPLFRPLERAIERNLGIDMVRFNSNIARNLFYSSIGFGKNSFNRSTPLINPFNTQTPYLFLMQSSEITLGKYLTQNLFFTYTGQLVSFYDQSRPSFDINHSFGLEYRFLRNILLEIEYDRELMGYYKIQNQKQYLEDIKIRLRHSFTF